MYKINNTNYSSLFLIHTQSVTSALVIFLLMVFNWVLVAQNFRDRTTFPSVGWRCYWQKPRMNATDRDKFHHIKKTFNRKWGFSEIERTISTQETSNRCCRLRLRMTYAAIQVLLLWWALPCPRHEHGALVSGEIAVLIQGCLLDRVWFGKTNCYTHWWQ